MNSQVFKKLLEVVLTFGNFLNQGSFRGNAQAVKVRFHIIGNARIQHVGKSQSCMVSKCTYTIKVNFLGELKSTKANAGKSSISNYNMLHYLNEYLGKEGAPKTAEGGKSLQNWHDEMACAQEALKIDPDQLGRDLV